MTAPTFTPVLVDFSNPTLQNLIAGATGNSIFAANAMGFFGTWSSTVTYSHDSVVIYDSAPYLSKIDNNIDFNPLLFPANWQSLGQGNNSFPDITDTPGVSVEISVDTILDTTLAVAGLTTAADMNTGNISCGSLTTSLPLNSLYIHEGVQDPQYLLIGSFADGIPQTAFIGLGSSDNAHPVIANGFQMTSVAQQTAGPNIGQYTSSFNVFDTTIQLSTLVQDLTGVGTTSQIILYVDPINLVATAQTAVNNSVGDFVSHILQSNTNPSVSEPNFRLQFPGSTNPFYTSVLSNGNGQVHFTDSSYVLSVQDSTPTACELTFSTDGTNLITSTTNSSSQTTDNFTIGGTLTVDGVVNTSDDVNVVGDITSVALTASGLVTGSAGLAISGSSPTSTIDVLSVDTLSVTNPIDVLSVDTLSVTNLSVTNPITTLDVGALTTTGDIICGGNISVVDITATNTILAPTIEAGTYLVVGGSAAVGYAVTITGPSQTEGLDAGQITSTATVTAATGIIDTAGGVTATAGGVTATAGGLTATAGGLTVTAGGATVAGDSTITGTFGVSGTTTSGSTLTVNAGGGTVHGNLTILADASVTPGQLQHAGNLLPTSNNAVNCGGSAAVYANGYFTNVNYTNLVVISDKKRKKYVVDLEEDTGVMGLPFIKKLKPKHFQYNDDTKEKIHLGFIAQEVDQTLQEIQNETPFITEDMAMVTSHVEEKEGTILGLNLLEFIAPLVLAVQSLDAKVNDLTDICENQMEMIEELQHHN